MSTQVKHTPGPWRAEISDHYGSYRLSSGEGYLYFLGARTSLEKEEHKANARLISAAPDLLEALEEMFDLFCGDGCMRENWDAHFANAKSQARAAINKAKEKGGES